MNLNCFCFYHSVFFVEFLSLFNKLVRKFNLYFTKIRLLKKIKMKFLQIVSFYFTLAVVTSSISSKVTKIDCKSIDFGSSCVIDGSNIPNTTEILQLSTNPSGNVKIFFHNFANFSTKSFKNLFNFSQLTLTNSNVVFENNANFEDTAMMDIYLINCSATFLNGGLSFMKKLNNLFTRDTVFMKIEGNAFEGIKNFGSISIGTSKITEELMSALNKINTIKYFTCFDCGLDSFNFPNFLSRFKAMDILSVTNTEISYIECKSIKHLMLLQGLFEENKLNETFHTCAVDVMNIRSNQVEKLHIQADTRDIDASNNSIFTIICDSELDLIILNLNNNKLSYLQCIATIPTLQELYIDSNNFSFFKNYQFDELKNLRFISVVNNQFKYLKPNLLTSAVTESPLIRIGIDKFDFGYEYLRDFYPKLQELHHRSMDVDCYRRNLNLEYLIDQNIRFYEQYPVNCSSYNDLKSINVTHKF